MVEGKNVKTQMVVVSQGKVLCFVLFDGKVKGKTLK